MHSLVTGAVLGELHLQNTSQNDHSILQMSTLPIYNHHCCLFVCNNFGTRNVLLSIVSRNRCFFLWGNPDGGRCCQMLPDGASWCQIVPDAARCCQPRCCQVLSDASRCWQVLPDAATCCLMLPDAARRARSCQMLGCHQMVPDTARCWLMPTPTQMPIQMPTPTTTAT